ncbi:MAG: AGE family epimerase/isomerase [Verrucomicrobiota bacterium]|nr:AGE family epimerase/isomerase [Verrucomicrobiota bacterium]
MKPFKPLILKSAALPQLRRLAPVYRRVLLAGVDCIIARFLRNGDYPFIDTKIDIFTGRDLSRIVGGVDIFGRDTVYSWIQSRGMEALAGHAAWIRTIPLPAARKKRCLAELHRILESVTRKMEAIRRRNGGGLYFWMDKHGHPFGFDSLARKIPVKLDPAVATLSDSFHVKALAAAAELIKDRSLMKEARRYFARWIRCVKADRVRSDQQPFDPKNPVGHAPNRKSHGARMITLGGLAVYARLFKDAAYTRDGIEFIAHILDCHVNIGGRFPGLKELDFVEYIDLNGNPCRADGDILCDPGHAMEFVGLAFKFLAQARGRKTLTAKQRSAIARYDEILPRILLHAFELGVNKRVGGICKTVSLNRRVPRDSDMPWWNLPETMRAAMFAAGATPDARVRAACLDVARRCSNAFLGRFVNPKVHLMAYQTLDAGGKPVRTIPGTPDLDPGYHTGLSIIDFLNELQRQSVVGGRQSVVGGRREEGRRLRMARAKSFKDREDA